MTTERDTAALRALAEAATPGPWQAEETWPAGTWWIDDEEGATCWTVNGPSKLEPEGEGQGWHHTEADAAYIAAVDPQTVLALLDRAERAEAVVAAAKAWRDEMVAVRRLMAAQGLTFGPATEALAAAVDAVEAPRPDPDDDWLPDGRHA